MVRSRSEWLGGGVAKVYVSSTIADLQPERQAALEWLRLARHQAVDSYLPDSDTVRDSCLKDVCTCDVYMLILGHRYGFQPPEDNPEGLSITHLEYRQAGECGIPRVALLRTSIPDVRLSDLQDPERAPLVLRFRDEVARTVRAAEFSDLQGLIQGLSTGVQGELDKLTRQDKPDERLTGPATAGQALRLAPRSVFLAGRDKLLAKLDAELARDDESGPRVVALCGLGGVGKTSVAVEFAYRYLHGCAVVWQFAAQEATTLKAQFGELAALLGPGRPTDVGDPVAQVHSMLAVIPGQWLLVFDNAQDEASVQNVLPPAGNGRVLITSQNPQWSIGRVIEVPALDDDVAAELLQKRTRSTDQSAARHLARDLGGLPLALEQACAFMTATGRELTEYQSMFHERRADLLRRGEPGGHDRPVIATWSLAFDQIQKNAPQAIGLLRLLASCAPDDIPIRRLLDRSSGLAVTFSPEVASVITPLLEGGLEVDDAVAALRRYSLISPVIDGKVSVHRLVQAITLDQMTPRLAASWQQTTASLIRSALPTDPQQPSNWWAFKELLPHAEVALPVSDSAVTNIANYLGYEGQYLLACSLDRKIIQARERILGAEHPDTLKARAWLATWTGEAGDPATARDMAAALLPVQARVLGAEHPDTLATRASLARWTGTAKDPVAARDQFAELLQVQTRILGAEHPDTLTTRASLATWTGQAGDAATARDQYAELLPIRARVLGAEHPVTLATRANVAYWTGVAGKAAAARDQFAALIPIRERVLGPEHPDTLTSRGNLARWTGMAGNAAAARDQFAALIPIRERVLGPEHPDTQAARASLAHWSQIEKP
jgi:Domain of unknown function (DUF4062)/Tetratricopeptide repeat